jgi:hypothetical protein
VLTNPSFRLVHPPSHIISCRQKESIFLLLSSVAIDPASECILHCYQPLCSLPSTITAELVNITVEANITFSLFIRSCRRCRRLLLRHRVGRQLHRWAGCLDKPSESPREVGAERKGNIMYIETRSKNLSGDNFLTHYQENR